MLTNKIKTNRKVSRADIFYYALFIIYAILITLVFIYSIRFLVKTINSAFSSPQSTVMEAKYGQLRLDEYALVADKLGLKAAAPSQNQINMPSVPIDLPTETSTTSASNITTSTLELTATSSVETNTSSPVAVIVPETKPQISVINSTLSAGLAGELRKQLQAAGFTVPNIGNSQPSEAQTIIKVKNSVNQNSNYFSEIKKIVSNKYDFIITTLDSAAKYDIEIIIGDK
jgi:hypothetical protein